MWACPRCQHQNEAIFDLCSKCGSSQSGERDAFLAGVSRWRRRGFWLLLCLPLTYLTAYFLLGRHRSGIDYTWSGYSAQKYAWHDRLYPFDPWFFKPLASAEHSIRGPRTQIVIQDGRYRGGEPTYVYGPDP